MPNKLEAAPKWSEKEMQLAEQFVIIGHTFRGDFLKKRDDVAVELAKSNLHGFPGSTTVQRYIDLPAGVRSAVSHLASEASKARRAARKAEEERIDRDHKATTMSRLLKEAEEEWLAQYGGNEELDESQARFRLSHPLDPDLDPEDIIRGRVREEN